MTQYFENFQRISFIIDILNLNIITDTSDRHVARMGEERGCIVSWWGNRRVGDHGGDLGVDGWIILGWISRRWDVGIWIGLGWPRIETCGGRL